MTVVREVYRGSVMLIFIFLVSRLVILAATSSSSVVTEVPQQLEAVDVLFFQAFLLVRNSDKVADLRNRLKEALSNYPLEKGINYAAYSDKPLFKSAISTGFKRYSHFNTMGISKSNKPPQGTSALKFYTEYLYKYLRNVLIDEENPQKAFRISKYIRDDSLLTNQILTVIGQYDNDLENLPVVTMSISYRNDRQQESTTNGRSSKHLKEPSPVSFQLPSPKLASLPLPTPHLSLKIYSDLLPNDNTLFTKIEEYFAENWGTYFGQRGSLVEEMIIKEELPAFEKGILSLVGSKSVDSITCASDLALAKAYNITGYLPFPNYRNPYELYLNNLLQARMLLNFPELRQANIQNLKMSLIKSIDALQVFLDALPFVTSSVLIAKQVYYQRYLHRLAPTETYFYSDYDYWKVALRKSAFPWEILPHAHEHNNKHKSIIDCFTIESCIAPLINEQGVMPPIEELPLQYITLFGRHYYNLSQLYLQSMLACQKQCPEYSPYFSRADKKPLTLRDLLLFEITIAQVMKYKNNPCLAPRIRYILSLLKYLQDYSAVDSQTVEYAYKQIQLLINIAL